MNHADINFYFDPLCPFAWMTSKWVRQVTAQRDYTVDWRFISLRMLNGELRAETDEALALTGKDVGTPIIHFGPPRGTAFSGRSSAGRPVTRRRSGCGTTSSGSPPSPASPSSSAACENDPSCAASASAPARPASRRTGTAEAGASRNKTENTLRGEK